MPTILIADDQADVLEALRLLLKGEGYQTVTVNSPAAIVEALKTRDFDVLLMDLNYARDTTSGQEGLDLLTRIHALDGTLPVVVAVIFTCAMSTWKASASTCATLVNRPWPISVPPWFRWIEPSW